MAQQTHLCGSPLPVRPPPLRQTKYGGGREVVGRIGARQGMFVEQFMFMTVPVDKRVYNS